MRPDISSRKDIQLILSKFYDTLLVDKKMFPFFEEIIKENNLEHHIEIITNFWHDILFDTTTYSNNTMQKHLDKNVFIQFKKEHFTIWTSYFFSTIDLFFEGENAEKMKNRARSISMVMQLKMKIFEN